MLAYNLIYKRVEDPRRLVSRLLLMLTLDLERLLLLLRPLRVLQAGRCR
jgi:hypothetical protein